MPIYVNPELKANKDANNGYAGLDSNGKVSSNALPNSVMEFKGQWNASTNTPALADNTGNAGDVYEVSVGATRDLGSGNIAFVAGQRIIHSGTAWQISASDVVLQADLANYQALSGKNAANGYLGLNASGNAVIGNSAVSVKTAEIETVGAVGRNHIVVASNSNVPSTAKYKAKGSIASPTAVTNGTVLTSDFHYGYDGTNYYQALELRATVSGTPATNYVPIKFDYMLNSAAGEQTTPFSISPFFVRFGNNYSEKLDNTLSISTNTLSIDLNLGSVFTVSHNANITTFNINNSDATAGQVTSFTLHLTQDGTGGRTAAGITSNANIKFASTPSPNTTANKVNIYSFYTVDNGSTWIANYWGSY